MRRTLLLVVLVMSIVGLLNVEPVSASEQPLVVATIGPLASIVQEAFPGVRVITLIPPGVDPHEYQLTAKQITQIEDADVIVTTGGHLPVEKKLVELEKEGVIKGKVLLFDDYSRWGFRYLRETWYTGKYNPHGNWLDPYNAIAIAAAVKEVLDEEYPSMAPTYNEEFERFKENVMCIVRAYANVTPNATAIIGTPPVQYALQWMGIKVVDAIKPEEEAPAKGVDELLGEAVHTGIIAYSKQSSQTVISAAKELSEKSGRPSVGVIVFWQGVPYTKVLLENSRAVLTALGTERVQVTRPEANEYGLTYVLTALLAGLSLGAALGYVMRE